jgi:hypothetical protein
MLLTSAAMSAANLCNVRAAVQRHPLVPVPASASLTSCQARIVGSSWYRITIFWTHSR